MRISSLVFILMPLILIFAGGCSTEAPAPVDRAATVVSAWTELGPDQTQIVRVVMTGPHCPVLTTDQGPVATQPRSTPNADFPVQVCEARLPRTTRSAGVAGDRSVPLLPTAARGVKRIVILGDTGCRIKPDEEGESTIAQACNDPAAWPFTAIAASAAAFKPDLVIHVGDYHYREGKCPAGQPACAGATPGDAWNSWNEDFITPAAPLLRAAPWITVRGNHESCARAGQGWFLLLEPTAWQAQCQETRPVFEFNLGDHVFDVVDSSQASNLNPSFAALKPGTKSYRWILSHRPFSTPNAIEPKYNVALPEGLAAPGKVNLVLAGHWHVLALNTFSAKDHPTEFIVGNGGTMLDENPRPFKDQTDLTTQSYDSFGFLTLERKGKGANWELVEHDVHGKPVLRCRLHEDKKKPSQLTCS